VSHEPAAAISVSDGWYGTDAAIHYVYEAVNVTFGSSKVEVSPVDGAQTELKVRPMHCIVRNCP
jgi:hypothetical protein